MMKLEMLSGLELDCINYVHFTTKGRSFTIVIRGAILDHQYKSLHELPEYAIIDLLKREFKWSSRFLEALLIELELFDSALGPTISLGSIGICDWKFQTLEQVRLILHTLTMVDCETLTHDQIKQFVIDQTGLPL